MTKSLADEVLRSARVAELRGAVLEIAALAKMTPVELPRRKSRARIIRLLALERKRNARLIAELTRG